MSFHCSRNLMLPGQLLIRFLFNIRLREGVSGPTPIMEDPKSLVWMGFKTWAKGQRDFSHTQYMFVSPWAVMIWFIFTQQTEMSSLQMPSIIYALVLKFHSERRYKKLEGQFLIHIRSPFVSTLSKPLSFKSILPTNLESLPTSTAWLNLPSI